VRDFLDRHDGRLPARVAREVASKLTVGVKSPRRAVVDIPADAVAQAFPDSRLEVHTLIEAGNRVVVEGAYAGTHTGPLASPQGTVPPTGRTLALPYCEVFEVSAGRIASKHVYYDQMTFAAQLGLLPELAPAS